MIENQEYIENAMRELEKVNVEELPKVIQQAVMTSHLMLMNASAMLEDYKVIKENEKWNLKNF